jgi:hypothetical protein
MVITAEVLAQVKIPAAGDTGSEGGAGSAGGSGGGEGGEGGAGGDEGGEGDAGGGTTRGPQSVQSMPSAQCECSFPRPPSSQLPSEA